MSEKLPYEQHLHQQWNNLPLPDENLCWDDMKRRLDEDDDTPVVAWWRRGCALWGLLLIGLIVGAVWLTWQRDEEKREKEKIARSEEEKEEKKDEIAGRIEGKEEKNDEVARSQKAEKDKKDTGYSMLDGRDTGYKMPDGKDDGYSILDSSEKMSVDKNPNLSIQSSNKKKSIDRKAIAHLRASNSKKPTHKQQLNIVHSSKQEIVSKILRDTSAPPRLRGNKPATHKQQNDSIQSTTNTNPETQNIKQEVDSKILRDSSAPLHLRGNKPTTHKQQIDSIPSTTNTKLKTQNTNKDSSTITTPKKETPTSNTFFYSAGLGLYQQLPLAGQSFTPYDRLGRKGSLLDYIPSIYFAYHKKNKWFIQGEFRYGAPQYTKSVEFFRNTKVDTSNRSAEIKSFNAKKTFYHQLPVSFNYNITKNWTIGTGVVWNKFSSAVVESSETHRDLINQSDSVLTRTIETVPDSVRKSFKGSYFQALLQTQYSWKRFTLGARYSIGLQPYLQFRLDGGEEQKQRTSVLQLFLNVRLWNGKEREKK